MKIGDFEITDLAFEAFLKQSGKRYVDESDYTKKAEAANDLAKFRAVTGEGRSIEDLGKILKAHEDNEKKNKTETQLLTAELERVNKELAKAAQETKAAQFEVRKQTINKHFDSQMALGNLKVIEPILDEFRKPFYDMDESKMSQEELAGKVNEAITKAAERQNVELQRLGLGNTANSAIPSQPTSFGGVNVTPPKGGVIGQIDPFQMIRANAATPYSTPFQIPTPKQGN